MRKRLTELDESDSRIGERTVRLLEIVHNGNAETLNELSAYLVDFKPSKAYAHVDRLVDIGLLNNEADGWQQKVELSESGETLLRERYIE
jgi:predicted transcriptional regulator